MNFKKNLKKLSHWFLTRPNLTGFLIFLVLITAMGFFVKLRYEVIKENERREMSNIINVVEQNFEQVLKNSYITTLTLAMTINDKGEPENFERVASELVNKNASINAVQLVPDGVIKYVYPLKGNEAALNYDILNSPNVDLEAKKSIHSKIIYFAGPLRLKQGGIGIIGRLPVFKNNKFWGFSAVIIGFDTLIRESGIQAIDDSRYYFQLSKINPKTKKEEFFLPGDKSLEGKFFQSVVIPDGDWKLYLIARDDNSIFYQLTTSLSLGCLLCIISVLWIISIMKKPAKLQKLIERQTQKISKRETEFKAIFNQAPVGIAKLNTDTGDFITVNKEYLRIVGYSEEELLATNFQSITHPDDLEEDLKNMAQLKKGLASEFCLEKRYIHKSGEVVWVNLIVSILGKMGKHIENHIAIVEDITDKKRAEEELKQSFELVSEQNKRLLNFSFIVSHNLRSHTSNIELISTLLETVKTPEEHEEMINMLKKVSKSLDETLRNLNEVVNIRTNINLTIEQLNLKHYIEKSKTLLNRQIINRNAEIENLVPADVEINYNAAYLESIIYNFMSNAIRYSHPDRKPIVRISYDESRKAMTISDNGIGIDMKRYGDNLFGMYKTFHNNPDAKGIGLFITKNQIDAMGGKIETESTLNKGTTFTIYFK